MLLEAQQGWSPGLKARAALTVLPAGAGQEQGTAARSTLSTVRPATGHTQRSHVRTVPGEVTARSARPAATQRSPWRLMGRCTSSWGPCSQLPAWASPGPHLVLGHPAPAWHPRPQRESPARSPRGQGRAALGQPPARSLLHHSCPASWGCRWDRSPETLLRASPGAAFLGGQTGPPSTPRPAAHCSRPGRRECPGLNLRGRAGFHSRSRLPRALQEDATCLKLK